MTNVTYADMCELGPWRAPVKRICTVIPKYPRSRDPDSPNYDLWAGRLGHFTEEGRTAHGHVLTFIRYRIHGRLHGWRYDKKVRYSRGGSVNTQRMLASLRQTAMEGVWKAMGERHYKLREKQLVRIRALVAMELAELSQDEIDWMIGAQSKMTADVKRRNKAMWDAEKRATIDRMMNSFKLAHVDALQHILTAGPDSLNFLHEMMQDETVDISERRKAAADLARFYKTAVQVAEKAGVDINKPEQEDPLDDMDVGADIHAFVEETN